MFHFYVKHTRGASFTLEDISSILLQGNLSYPSQRLWGRYATYQLACFSKLKPLLKVHMLKWNQTCKYSIMTKPSQLNKSWCVLRFWITVPGRAPEKMWLSIDNHPWLQPQVRTATLNDVLAFRIHNDGINFFPNKNTRYQPGLLKKNNVSPTLPKKNPWLTWKWYCFFFIPGSLFHGLWNNPYQVIQSDLFIPWLKVT